MATAKKGAAKKPAAKKGAAKKPAAKKPAAKKIAAKTVQGRKVTAEVKKKGAKKDDKGCVRVDIGGGRVVDLCVAPKKKAKKAEGEAAAEKKASMPRVMREFTGFRRPKSAFAGPRSLNVRTLDASDTLEMPAVRGSTLFPVRPSKGVRRRRRSRR
jgi:hypothetical protein